MRLIQIQGDVIVADEVRMIELIGDTIYVSFRNLPEHADWEFEKEEDAQEAMRQAVKALLGKHAEPPMP